MYNDRDFDQPWLRYAENEARPSAAPSPYSAEPPPSDDRGFTAPPPRGAADDYWP
jgi:hypothetical protein